MTELNLIGQTLGRFEILTELGRGGMAVVYQARQTDLERLVALKVLPPALTLDPSYVARFRQEARSVARLEHPHIMPIYEIGEADGLHYIAMKLIAGQTVKDLLETQGSLPLDQAITMIEQVGAALDYAHRQGVIHRDIKPSNMMITAEGWIYLTDFGLARGEESATGGLTLAGTVMGTPEYMSPEQAQGLASVGPSTDIYALGVVLYELLTGDFPFQADTPMGMLAARLLHAPIPPRDRRADLSPAVEDVIMRSLARKPEARFANATALLAALRDAAGLPANAAPSPHTPAMGVPAIGATIQVALPPATVQPRNPTPPEQTGPTALPPPPPPAAPPKRTHPFMIVLATIGGMVVLCIALLVALAVIGVMVEEEMHDGPTPGPGLSVALPEANALLATPGGLLPALAIYQQIFDNDPTEPLAQAHLAQAQLVAGNWAEAISAAEDLRTNPDSDPNLTSLAAAIHAEALLALGDVTGATAQLESESFAEPHPLYQASQAHWLAHLALSIGDTNTLDAAFDLVDQADDQLEDLDETEDRLDLALSYATLGETMALAAQLTDDDAHRRYRDEYYVAALELVPGATRWLRLQGQAYLDDGAYELAHETFNVALDQSDALAHAGLGWVAFDEGEFEQAEQAFAAAIRTAPDEGAGYYGKGRLRFAEGDFVAATEAFALAAERNPSSAEIQAWLGKAHFELGYAVGWPASRPAFELAEAAYRTALAHDDHLTLASAGLAWTLQHQERYREAVEQFEATLALDPHNASHYDGKGWSLFNQGLYVEAEASLRQALEQDPTYVEALWHLGRTLEQQGGRANEARAAYTEALSYEPDHPEAQAGLARLGR